MESSEGGMLAPVLAVSGKGYRQEIPHRYTNSPSAGSEGRYRVPHPPNNTQDKESNIEGTNEKSDADSDESTLGQEDRERNELVKKSSPDIPDVPRLWRGKMGDNPTSGRRTRFSPRSSTERTQDMECNTEIIIVPISSREQINTRYTTGSTDGSGAPRCVPGKPRSLPANLNNEIQELPCIFNVSGYGVKDPSPENPPDDQTLPGTGTPRSLPAKLNNEMQELPCIFSVSGYGVKDLSPENPPDDQTVPVPATVPRTTRESYQGCQAPLGTPKYFFRRNTTPQMREPDIYGIVDTLTITKLSGKNEGLNSGQRGSGRAKTPCRTRSMEECGVRSGHKCDQTLMHSIPMERPSSDGL